MTTLVQAVRNTLVRAGLWREDAMVLCALSGGCDSVALLHALCSLREEGGLRICAIHVQHGLRGEDSLADEQFVRCLCAAWHVPLVVENAGLNGDMHTTGMETMARECRRRIFADAVERLQANALLTAHHLDDQAETVLMHLLRGSGMKGLCGMTQCVPFGHAVLLRPFLSIPKSQIREALKAEEVPSREDQSNQEAVTPRNALRLTVLPQLNALFPGAAGHVAAAAETLAADEECLSQLASDLYERAFYAVPPLFLLRAETLLNAPEALCRRVMRRWYAEGLRAAGLQPEERSLSHADTLQLCQLIQKPAGSAVNLPCGLMARRGQDHLYLLRQSGQALCLADNEIVSVECARENYALAHLVLRLSPAASIPENACTAVLTPAVLVRRPVLRAAQPEDRIHPFGAPGSKPLRRWLTDRKLDPEMRAALTVLCIGSEVLWIPGLCTSETLRLDRLSPGSMQLTIESDTPLIPNLSKE